MKIRDLPGYDFIRCDACDARFEKRTPPIVMGVEDGNKVESISALCARCLLAVATDTELAAKAQRAAYGRRRTVLVA